MIENAPILSCRHAGLTIEGYSRAAVQTYWRIPELKIGFDLGAHPWDFMGTPTWLITHTHLDHIAALPVYVARRRMMRMEPPTLYLPAEALEDVRRLLLIMQRLDRGRQVCELIGVKPGDEIEVFLERLEDPSGYVILSREKAERMLVWDRIEAAFKADQPISGRVIDRVKGGLSVDVGGIKAFLPGSLIDTKPVKNLDALRGHEYKFKIVSFDKKRSNVVLSRRAIVEVEEFIADVPKLKP